MNRCPRGLKYDKKTKECLYDVKEMLNKKVGYPKRKVQYNKYGFLLGYKGDWSVGIPDASENLIIFSETPLDRDARKELGNLIRKWTDADTVLPMEDVIEESIAEWKAEKEMDKMVLIPRKK